ncbi:MAG: phosphatase PAP2 family protein [Candidatus Aminicenantes bacterium]|nr:phosphatase PAP2 family protein [Candidatus Aminicenantes bacterium]
MKGLPAALLPLIGWDQTLFKFINSHHSAAFDPVFWSLSAFGSYWGIVPAFFVFILLKAKKNRIGVILAASAVALTAGGLLIPEIKEALNHPRPSIYFKAPEAGVQLADMSRSFAVHTVGPRLPDASFPSGHSWTAFAVATLMTLFFGRKYAWAFFGAAAIGYSRIYAGAHFPLDVLGGALCGTLLAFLVWRVTAWITPGRARPQG